MHYTISFSFDDVPFMQVTLVWRSSWFQSVYESQMYCRMYRHKAITSM